MKRTILTLTLACQMAAGAAFAQTEGTGGPANSDAMSESYGSDWSLSLGPALFGEDGRTLRADSEITNQWETLSDEDQAMLRRDCLAHSQQSSTADGTTGAATDGTTESASDAPATTDTTAGVAGSPMAVSAEQMERICSSVKGL